MLFDTSPVPVIETIGFDLGDAAISMTAAPKANKQFPARNLLLFHHNLETPFIKILYFWFFKVSKIR